MFAIGGVFGSAFMRLIHGRHREPAGKIGAEYGEEKEFTLRLNVRARGEIIAQMPLRQEIGEKHRQAGGHGTCRRNEPAFLSLERKAQSRSVWIVNIALLERKKMAVASNAVDDADAAAVEVDRERVQGFGIKIHRGLSCRTRILRRRRHKAAARRTRAASVS